MTNKTDLFLFAAIATILLTSPLASGNAFADDDKDKKDKKNKDDKKYKNPFKALWDAIAGLQAQIDALKLKSGSQGPQGPRGINGTNGLQGPAGPSGTGHISFDGTPSTISLGDIGSSQASCPTGNVQVGSHTLDGKLVGIICQHITMTP